MRNILEHPIQKAEIVELLDRYAAAHLRSQVIGGLDGVILDGIKKMILEVDDEAIDHFFGLEAE